MTFISPENEIPTAQSNPEQGLTARHLTYQPILRSTIMRVHSAADVSVGLRPFSRESESQSNVEAMALADKVFEADAVFSLYVAEYAKSRLSDANPADCRLIASIALDFALAKAGGDVRSATLDDILEGKAFGQDKEKPNESGKGQWPALYARVLGVLRPTDAVKSFETNGDPAQVAELIMLGKIAVIRPHLRSIR